MHVSAVVHPELELSVCTDLIAFTMFLLLLPSCNSKGTIYSDLLNPVPPKLLFIPALLA